MLIIRLISKLLLFYTPYFALCQNVDPEERFGKLLKTEEYKLTFLKKKKRIKVPIKIWKFEKSNIFIYYIGKSVPNQVRTKMAVYYTLFAQDSLIAFDARYKFATHFDFHYHLFKIIDGELIKNQKFKIYNGDSCITTTKQNGNLFTIDQKEINISKREEVKMRYVFHNKYGFLSIEYSVFKVNSNEILYQDKLELFKIGKEKLKKYSGKELLNILK